MGLGEVASGLAHILIAQAKSETYRLARNNRPSDDAFVAMELEPENPSRPSVRFRLASTRSYLALL